VADPHSQEAHARHIVPICGINAPNMIIYPLLLDSLEVLSDSMGIVLRDS
jgi:hypothetical protein